VSERWQPVSPLTGRLDAFEWRDPLSGRDGGAMIESLPPPPEPRAVAPPAPIVYEAPRPAAQQREVSAPEPVARETPRKPVSETPPPPPAEEKPAESVYEPPPASMPEPARLRAVQTAPSSSTVALPPRIEKVIPLVHAPDDPGPEHDAAVEPLPEPAAEPSSEGWNRIRRLLKP
jgi:HemY protein